MMRGHGRGHDPEHLLQAEIIRLADLRRAKHPELEWLHAVPNGGGRSKSEAGRMKAEGVRPGVADLFLPVARGEFHGLYIEVKIDTRLPGMRDGVPGIHRRRTGLTDNQRTFKRFVESQGYAHRVIRSAADAERTWTLYLKGGVVLPDEPGDRA